MIPALILAISMLALVRFALNYWRAILTGVSDQPISAEVRAAAGIIATDVSGQDFAALANVHRLTPGSSFSIALVSLYYHLIDGIALLGKRQMGMAAWSQREMAACAHYIGVQIDRRLQLSVAPLA